MAKDLKLVLLLDCYGALLTQRQRQATQFYYDEDLSLGEIAQITGTSRQAVRDSIKRSEQILYEMEEKLHFAARIAALQKQYETIAAAMETIAQAAKENLDLQQHCAAAMQLTRDGMRLLSWTASEEESDHCIP